MNKVHLLPAAVFTEMVSNSIITTQFFFRSVQEKRIDSMLQKMLKHLLVCCIVDEPDIDKELLLLQTARYYLSATVSCFCEYEKTTFTTNPKL